MKSQIFPFYYSKKNKPGVRFKKISLKHLCFFTVWLLTLIGVQICFPTCLEARGGFSLQERFSSTDNEPKVELVVQNSNEVFVYWPHRSQMSQDGKFIITTDGTGIIIWTSSGRKIRRISLTQFGEFTSAKFSPDTTQVLSGTEDSVVLLWDTHTGKEIRRYQGHTEAITDVSFSPDGQILATASFDCTVRFWDRETGKQINQLNHATPVQCVRFSPNGQLVATSGFKTTSNMVDFDPFEDTAIHLWDAHTGKEIRKLKGHSSYINEVAFSPDGKMIASGGRDYTARIWNPENGKELQRFVLTKADFVEIEKENTRVFSKDSLEKAKQLNKGTGILSVAFSPNSQFLVTGSGQLNLAYKHDTATRVWEIRSGNQIHKFSHGSPVTSVNFSSEGRYIIATESSRYFSSPTIIWDTHTEKEHTKLLGYSSPVFEAKFSQNGKYIITHSMVTPSGFIGTPQSSETQQIEFWDITTGTQPYRIVGDQNHSIVDISNEAKLFATVEFDRQKKKNSVTKICEIWANTIREVFRIDQNLRQCMFSPDGRFLYCLSKGDELSIWNLKKATLENKLSNISGRMAFISPDNKFLCLVDGSKAFIWDLTNEKVVRELSEEDGDFEDIQISKSNQYVITSNTSVTLGPNSLKKLKENRIRIWDFATGKQIFCITGDTKDQFSDFSSIDVSPNGKLLLAARGFSDGGVGLWTLPSGKLLNRFNVVIDNAWIYSSKFSPDGKFALVGSNRGLTSVWSLDTGQELCRLISFFDGTWVVTMPDGRFDTNNLETIRGLYWVISDDPMNPLPVDTFAREYYEPRLLPRVLAGEVLPPIPSVASLNRAVPKVSISDIRRTAAGSDKVSITIEVATGALEVTRNGTVVRMESEAQDVRLFRDGQLVGYQDGDVKFESSAGPAKITFSNIDLPRRADQSQVEFAAYAFNQDHVKSETFRSWIAIPSDLKPRSRRAYLISLGVNTNSQPGLELRYAANDARRFQATVGDHLLASGEFEDVVRLPLLSEQASDGSSETDQAVKANLKAVLDLLAGKPVSPQRVQSIPNASQIRQAHPEDLVMITFSGHGVASDQGIFYFVPSDTGTEPLLSEGFLKRCISSDELSTWLRGVDAGDLTLIVDACQSAALVDSNGFKPGPIGSRGLGQLSYDKGMRILAATQSDNVALESQSIQQGLLSYALTQEGLTERKADFNPQDRTISLTEWLMYGAERVPGLHQAMLNRTLPEGTRMLRYRAAETDLKLQQPQFFDFSRKTRDLILVRK